MCEYIRKGVRACVCVSREWGRVRECSASLPRKHARFFSISLSARAIPFKEKPDEATQLIQGQSMDHLVVVLGTHLSSVKYLFLLICKLKSLFFLYLRNFQGNLSKREWIFVLNACFIIDTPQSRISLALISWLKSSKLFHTLHFYLNGRAVAPSSSI